MKILLTNAKLLHVGLQLHFVLNSYSQDEICDCEGTVLGKAVTGEVKLSFTLMDNSTIGGEWEVMETICGYEQLPKNYCHE